MKATTKIYIKQMELEKEKLQQEYDELYEGHDKLSYEWAKLKKENKELHKKYNELLDSFNRKSNEPVERRQTLADWIKEQKETAVEGLKKPEQGDFIELDRFSEGYINSLRYAEALEKYCNELEKYCNELEKALDNACEYIHDCGSNGCPNNYDGEEMKECKMCNYECISLDYQLNSSKSQCDEYLKKSIKCWRKYFLKGEQ